MYFDFDMAAGESIEIQMALSSVSPAGALANLGAETSGKSFEEVRSNARKLWEKEFDKVEMKGAKDDMVNFYTALYHSLLTPIIYQDVDGKYKGLDQNIHDAKNFKNVPYFPLGYLHSTSTPSFQYHTAAAQQ